MGILDRLESQLGGNQQNVLLQQVSGLIANNGGLSGLVSRFTQSGLGEHVQSWVGNGENMPVTGDHISQVFGSDQIKQVAQKLGTDPAQASSMIAGILPSLVDKLTPQGQAVSDGEAQQGIAGLLSKGISSLFVPKQ